MLQAAAKQEERWAGTAHLASVCCSILESTKSIHKMPVPTCSEVEEMLAMFQCNNFSIWNELLVGLGASVFPFGAILNHRCDYNAVIMYDAHTKHQVLNRPINMPLELQVILLL